MNIGDYGPAHFFNFWSNEIVNFSLTNPRLGRNTVLKYYNVNSASPCFITITAELNLVYRLQNMSFM